MRILAIATLAICASAFLPAQAPGTKANAVATLCEDQRKALPDSYPEAVLARIRPPNSQDFLVSINLAGDPKLMLGTTGDHFQLWTYIPDLGGKNVREFLKDLADSCRLPFLPGEAAALVKVKWESKELSATQFDQIHREFTRAASAYLSKAQNRYGPLLKTKMLTTHLDALYFEITYDNQDEHFELRVWDEGDKSTDPMVKWGHDVLRLAAQSFHRSFGYKESD